MTPVYTIQTKHTKEVLEAFIKFTYRVKSGNMTFRLCLFGSGFLMIAYMVRDTLIPMIGFGLLGLLVLFFAFMRKNIAFQKLSQNDPNYQSGSEIIFTFGHGNFTVEGVEKQDKQQIQYGQVSSIYQDEDYFYLGVNNEDMHVLPKRDFTEGSPERFGEFVAGKSNHKVIPVKVPFKERIAEAKVQKKANEAKRDKEWEEWKAERKIKKK